MTTLREKLIEKLGEMGNVWENYGKSRIYFNSRKVLRAMGYTFEITREERLGVPAKVENTTFNGEAISHNKFRAVLHSVGDENYVDLTNGKFFGDSENDDFDAFIKAKIAEAKKELENEI